MCTKALGWEGVEQVCRRVRKVVCLSERCVNKNRQEGGGQPVGPY